MMNKISVSNIVTNFDAFSHRGRSMKAFPPWGKRERR